MSEGRQQDLVRLELPKLGCHFWRNNNGAGTLENGQFVRWGLANDSHALNARLKSSDLIGIVPVVITPDMVGKTVGVFGAVEMKPLGWRYNPHDDRERAQKAFIDLVLSLGGRAGFVTQPSELPSLLRNV